MKGTVSWFVVFVYFFCILDISWMFWRGMNKEQEKENVSARNSLIRLFITRTHQHFIYMLRLPFCPRCAYLLIVLIRIFYRFLSYEKRQLRFEYSIRFLDQDASGFSRAWRTWTISSINRSITLLLLSCIHAHARACSALIHKSLKIRG